MANEEHVALLKQGVDAWNKWRKKNPNVRSDLIEADLTGADLVEADLTGARLTGADLLATRGCSGGTLDFNFFVENGLAEFLKPSQWLRTTYEAPYQPYK